MTQLEREQGPLEKLDPAAAERHALAGVYHRFTGEPMPEYVPSEQFTTEFGGNGTLRGLLRQPVVVYKQQPAPDTRVKEWVNRS